MIKVIYRRKDHRLTVTGHAYSGQAGQDLVCAAASILACTLAADVENMAACEQVSEPIISLEVGRAEISCKPVYGFESVVALVFDSICSGYEMLSLEHPQNVKYKLRI